MKNKKIVIIGAGESGIGVALLAKNQGCSVFVSNDALIPLAFKNELLDHGISFEESHTKAVLDADLIVKSPGVPTDAPVIMDLLGKNKIIVSEIEFAYNFIDPNTKIIGITGTNGKTTTTSLIYHLLKKSNLDVAVAGNIGKSVSRLLSEKNYDYLVLELSSFQLENIDNFRVHIAVLLNITPDHLDRYSAMSDYTEAKFNILKNSHPTDTFVYNRGSEIISSYLHNILAFPKMKSFSQFKINFSEGYVDDEKLIIEHEDEKHEFLKKEISLVGNHNYQNVLAAILVALEAGVDTKYIRVGLRDFKGIEHRLEKVAIIDGIEFINDSKATNVEATYYALDAMTKKIIWIAGGVDKGNDYALIKSLVVQKVKKIICLGENNKPLKDAFSENVPIVETKKFDVVMEEVRREAKSGDVVLFSPACASFDLFKNYEERGMQFKKEVGQFDLANG